MDVWYLLAFTFLPQGTKEVQQNQKLLWFILTII